ncbi:metabolite traffic protein EboE [Arthrobacter koreensis]|uniref:metabolite traffic protein EboE n=1 Tax=Arthrobacter koreensis TaxID=199136 RepID=UPI002DBF17B4|nr:metabolite traffic protein EboE [Arthrobacter koreensis]MEB7505531.1 metabolite traffic protein EboE [Arthrobacter koreensis]
MQLSYCTNVHPAEDLDGVIRQLRDYAGPVRRRAGLDVLGVGLWLPAGLAGRLARSDADLALLREVLAEQGLQIHTLNAFPYGGFHNEVVKTDVYLPTWAQRERLQYTLECASVLAGLLPDGVPGSISTLPLAWRTPWSRDDDDAAVRAFAELSEGLRTLKECTGKTVRIAVEPEPGCVLDTVSDVTAWLAAGVSRGIDPDYIGLCVDTCHLAVSFADPAAAIRGVGAAGLRVVKIQASAALHVSAPAGKTARRALEAFAEPRYLHQVRELEPDGTVLTADDLPQALGELPGRGPWRIHFHMPLHLVPAPPLETTAAVLEAAVAEAGTLPYAEEVHLDIETYTWSVLPGKHTDLVEGIAGEIAWAQSRLLAHASS